MMKSVLIFFCVLTVSCTEVVLDNVSDRVPMDEQKSGTLTIEDALKELSDFNESLYGNIDVRSNDCISEIAICKIPSTKGTDSDEIIAYVVNYENDKGFAVINADPLSIPIVARTESGYMDSERLNSKILSIIGDYQTKSGNSLEDTIDSSSPEDFIYELIASSLATTPRSIVDTLSITYGEWGVMNLYGPLVTVKWNQTYPFNLSIPPDSLWLTKNYNYYRGLPPVGCTNVAVAQILTTIRQPSRAPGTNTTYDWNVFKSLSNYNNVSDYLPGRASYPFDTNPILKSKVEDLADFLYTIYDKNHSKVTSGGTSSNILFALETMQELNSEYFANAEIIEYRNNNSNLNGCINCIKNGKPIYCCGFYIDDTKSTGNDKKSGHAWVIDGYTERKRMVKLIVEDSDGNQQTMNRIQNGLFLHINWGYCGLYDGYYYKGNFDMAQREDYDDVIDTNPYTGNGSTSYSIGIEYIIY